MFTCLWQLWSWLDPPVTSPLTNPALITMASLKKSPGSGTPTKKGQLRSPVIKRPLSAPVTLQGWLHKQGSDGLMLWKKRWFVLSEYCLFYYKGSEEEKLLGSILLPSYKISPCSTEDKVYRKFSFKAEHVNMRTYYFAADNQQLMAQWMNALSLASILQESTTWEEHRSGLSTVSSQHNASADDSDSGFHGNFRPNTNDSTLECTTPSNGWRGNKFAGYHQPLYANAPPKPRRLNNDTSSPERSPERPSEDSGRMSRMAQPTEYQIRNDRPYHYNAQHLHRPPVLLPTTNQPQLNNTERRTPDTYGRSNSATPQTGKIISSKPRPSDYEDVYQNNPDLILTGSHNPMYVTYSNHRNQPVQYRRREPPKDISSSVNGQQRRFPPRPHSADFLEYDAKRYQSPTPQSSDSGNQGMYYNGQRFVSAQPRRPKSSLDIMHNEMGCVDGNYWSEESYARKMRQSASYVSPQLHNLSNSSRATTPSVRQVPLMSAHNCFDGTNGELASVKMREHSEAIRLQERRWSEYVDARANRPDQFVRSASARLPRQQRPDDRDEEGSDKSSQSTYKRRNSTDNRDGSNKTQQREESMKRLLEWKQRMLQSPLTRKSSGSSNRGVAQNEMSKYYKAQVLRELANQEARSRNLINQHQMPPNINTTGQWNRVPSNFDGDYWKKESWESKDHPVLEHRSSRRKHSDESGSRTARSRSQDGRRSASSLNRYNSYSSDDEELEETRECRKRVRRSSQAGRSRVNSLEGKSASRSTSTSRQSTAPDYENINIPENTTKSLKERTDFEKSGRSSATELLPDSSYSSSHKFNLEINKHEALKSRSRILVEKTPLRKKCVENHSPLPSNAEQYPTFETDIKTVFDDSNNLAVSGNVTYDDRFTMSSKHSDSGYDTLQTGSILPADPEVSDLLKFRFDKKRNPNPIIAYPVQTKIIKTPNDYEPWGSKLDETKLIKMFSYQYIKSGKEDGKSEDEDLQDNEPPKLLLSKRTETPPENIVQNRIKVFEPGKDDENKIAIPGKDNKLKMQEPLKMSPPMYQPNEAHVSTIRGVDLNTSIAPKKSPEEISNLKRSRRTSLHGFALGDAMSMLDEEAKYVKREILTAGRNPKSVRDLLADFERKSQLAKEKLAAEEKYNEDSSGKRYVFSDTETLLYDTSSDAEGNSDGSTLVHRNHRSETVLTDDDVENEDEDRDEEVAAALGKRDTFFSSCRDLGHKADPEARKRQPYKAHGGEQPDDVEVIMTPGYLRLSMAESMVTHEDLESHCSSPHPKTPVHKKPSMTSDMPKRCSSPEEHYMPMTPSKKSVLAPVNDMFANTRNNSASQTLIMENLLGEESSYVEMTQNGMIQSLLAPDINTMNTMKKGLYRLNSSGSNPDTPRYCEIGNEKDGTHYEFLYKTSTHTEPVYMEVSSLFGEKKNNEIDTKISQLESIDQSDSKREDVEGSEQPPTPPRAALPDIVNASGNSSHKQTSVKSDSSDADDEASKDLDSLDAPRHPRFSLSDTFRPASYYLGASISERTLIGMTSEHPDSSDSDLVSPPPIPTSPPPLDDLETSLESSVDLKKLSPIQIKSDSCKIDIEGSDDGRRLWNPTPVHSRDMRSIHSRMERLIIAPNLDDTLSSETDSIDSNKRDQLLKRRPVSADILNSLRDPNFLHSSPSSSRRSAGSDLESIGSRNGLAMDLEEGETIDLDQYLEELQVGNDLNQPKSLKDLNYDYCRMYKQDKYIKTVPPPLSVKPEISAGERMKYVVDQKPKTVVSSSQELIYSNEHVHQSSNSSQSFNHTDEVHYENLHGLFPPPPSAELLQELSASTNVVINQEESQTRNSVENGARSADHHEVRSEDLNHQQAGAPYYYSDLLKMEAEANNAASRAVVVPRSVRMQQLNNQRENVTFTEVNFLNKRNDIGRKVNVIHHLSSSDTLEDMDEASRLAQELRTTSVHFLGATDKSGQFDERNLYEADTLQRRKAVALIEQRSQSQPREDRNISRNLYPHGIRDKTESSTTSLSTINTPDTRQARRRSRSLEGLLDEPEFYEPSEPRQNRVSPGNAISRLLQTTQPQNQLPRTSGTSMQNLSTNPRSSRTRVPPPPPDTWEEDALWRESLRRVSIRHTRSLDDLDIESPRQNENPNHQNRKVSREVTYVNDVVTNRLRQNQREYEEDYREGRPVPKTNRVPDLDIDDGVHYERLVRDTETLERTRRGQTYLEGYVWDEEREMFHKGDKTALPSRDPPRKPSQPFLEVGLYPTRPPSFEIDREKLRQWDLMSSAPAGMLGAGRTGGAPSTLQLKPPTTQSLADETVQRTMANTGESTPPSSPASGSGSVIGRDPLPPRQLQPVPIVDKPPAPTRSPTQQAPPPQVPITTSPTGNNEVTHKRGDGSWNLQVSAGELLGRTHEELVLLLIQLRRQSAGFCKAMEACHMEIEAQARLAELETPKRLEHLQKLEDLKRHLLELEKQYEKGKPLVNLVDNMVKLGSLYRAGAPIQGSGMPLFRERLEFNHKVQEQRLLAEERKDWERLSPDHTQLQAKVEQLYRLDRILQEESGTLQSLQQDKEMLERAIGGLRHKLQGIHGNPAEAERYRRQQRLLERELSRVRSILAHNSKKLEETVAENARLEQELVVLRQKLQWSRRVPDSGSGPTTAALEAELRRVQTLVGDLQRQRQELSLQVRQLTEKSHSLSEQIRPGPTGVAGAGPIPGKKNIASSWLETDLDTQLTQDVGLDSPAKSPPQVDPARSQSPSAPLYVNTDESKAMDVCSTYESSISQDEQQELLSPPPTAQQSQYCRPMDISEADDRIKRFYGIIPRDKPQEIKTVRIVKRESERRQRDRDRSGNIGIPLTNTTSAKRVTIIEESFNGDSSDRQGLLGRVLEEPPEPPSEVFQGSAPLIRPLGPPPAPGPRSDSAIVLRNIVTRQNKAKLDSESSSPSRSISAHEQLFGSAASLGSVGSEGEGGLSPQLSPVYQSQAARQIIEEIAWRSGNKRLVPREKRRHHTVSGRPLLRIDTSYSASGSRDDLDMERALRPRLNAPDVVRSTLSRTDAKYTSETIDNILGTPGKIIIPERYVPESMPELTSEEQAKRHKKAEAIRKMLSETTSNTFQRTDISPVGTEIEEEEKSSTLRKKVAEEKRQREHLLQLNQILAQQVMEKSKMVAGVNSGSSQE